ncbi:phosphotransferase [Allomuricauda sp. F6463D]|uniref:phosphotransferase n=1 Tax=Allomuricauda sp. F6463D TaxID=2926409 RepID=UPI001FF2DF63|nr:phosphotransferase [Muricauda sp. F6463D]MCK0160043.1 phosphotransferase [Muricauda sp. F6463D]
MEMMTKDIDHLENYLRGQAWLKKDERITTVEIPGAGNMNFTLRIRTDQGSFILKQSRGYVEKYPQVSAPSDRALREAEFYTITTNDEFLRSKMPKLQGVDEENHVLKLADLGDGVDYTFLYEKNSILDLGVLEEIMDFAAALHTGFHCDGREKRLPNREMRKLNHEHIFVYPYLKENGLDLNGILPGLQEIGDAFKADHALKKKVFGLGERYLADGNVLLHGDYFPGSWLKTDEGLKIIDPEFCFFGEPEFEIGVTLAHLKMAGQPQAIVDKALAIYTDNAPIQDEVCLQFMAVEMVRRILGLAQLPLNLNLEERTTLLTEARIILLGP